MPTLPALPSLSELVILVLAGWYIQYVLRWHKGPFGLFAWIRRVIFGVVTGSGADVTIVRQGILAEIISCIYCLGFWVGVGESVAWNFIPIVLLPFAIVGGIVLLETAMQALSNVN